MGVNKTWYAIEPDRQPLVLKTGREGAGNPSSGQVLDTDLDNPSWETWRFDESPFLWNTRHPREWTVLPSKHLRELSRSV
jgi:hypothetical protein